MSEWYYARGGQQSGPVTLEQLGEIARNGGLDPVKDLVWTSAMKDWAPAGQVRELFPTPAKPVTAPPADPANPYAAPQSAWVEPLAAKNPGLNEIVHGSEPLDAVACVKRGFDLTKRQFGNILLVGLVYFAVIMGLSLVLGLVQGATGAVFSGGVESTPQASPSGAAAGIMVVGQIINQVVSLFVGLGLTRVGLNLVSGKEVSVGLLFGEGRKLLRALGASILLGLVVTLGLVLLIVPGIYLALRYSQCIVAIVDRDLGVTDAFSYSSSITTNNRLNLFLLWLLSFAVVLAGLLACGVGLVFAGPVVWLASLVAYRWMQYGHRAALDQPGTQTPMLAGQ